MNGNRMRGDNANTFSHTAHDDDEDDDDYGYTPFTRSNHHRATDDLSMAGRSYEPIMIALRTHRHHMEDH